LLKKDLEDLKIQLLLHGADRNEVDKLDITVEGKQKEKIVSLTELRMHGLGGSGKFRRKKRG
jgi:hypothetical protein